MNRAKTHLAAVVSLVSLGVAAAGCSGPTLEEACADYCEAIESAGCDRPSAQECTAQCDSIREQLDGKCVEEYTDTFDCGAGLDFECHEGNAVATDGGCVEEAFELLECTGFGSSVEDDARSEG